MARVSRTHVHTTGERLNGLRSFSVAIAYVMQKTPYVFPIVGGRKVEQLEGNIEALNVTLSEEQIKYLESSVPFDPGFPHTFCVSTAHAL